MTRISITLLGLAGLMVAQAPAPVILQVDYANQVSYHYDVYDYTKQASDSTATTSLPVRPFMQWVDVSDIVAVNGKPAKGIWITSGHPTMRFTTSVSPARAIADIARLAMVDQYFEILQPNGLAIGTI